MYQGRERLAKMNQHFHGFAPSYVPNIGHLPSTQIKFLFSPKERNIQRYCGRPVVHHATSVAGWDDNGESEQNIPFDKSGSARYRYRDRNTGDHDSSNHARVRRRVDNELGVRNRRRRDNQWTDSTSARRKPRTSGGAREWRAVEGSRIRNFDHDRDRRNVQGGHGRRHRSQRGPESESVTRSKLLAAKIKELGREKDWKGILRELEEGPRNTIVCTVAVNALGRLRKWREAISVLQDMGSGEDDKPDAYAYASVINACGKAGRPVEAVSLLSEMASRGIIPDQVCYGAAIAALSEVAGKHTHQINWEAVGGSNGSGNLPTAVEEHEDRGEVREQEDQEAERRDEEVNPSIVAAAAVRAEAAVPTVTTTSRSRAHEKAVSLIEEMRQAGLRPNQQCFGSAITACARARAPRDALRMLAIMREEGVLPNDVVLNAAVDACGKGDAPDQAVRLLRAMEATYGVKPNVITYNCAISGLSRAGRPREARALLKEMALNGVEPDHFSYSAAMQGYAAAGDSSNAAALSEEIKTKGITMDVVSYGTAVNACAKAGDVPGALKLIKEMEDAGLKVNVVVYNSALDACAKSGKPKDAAEIIKMMSESGVYPNVRSYTGAIAACSKVGDGNKAIDWLRVMWRKGVTPETISYNYAIAACGRSNQANVAARLLEEMRREGIPLNRITYSSAMFALGRVGRLSEVLDLLAEMHHEGLEADEVTYHIAVDAASIARNLHVAMDLFQDMRSRGLSVTKRRVMYIKEKIAGASKNGTRKMTDGDIFRRTAPDRKERETSPKQSETEITVNEIKQGYSKVDSRAIPDRSLLRVETVQESGEEMKRGDEPQGAPEDALEDEEGADILRELQKEVIVPIAAGTGPVVLPAAMAGIMDDDAQATEEDFTIMLTEDDILTVPAGAGIVPSDDETETSFSDVNTVIAVDELEDSAGNGSDNGSIGGGGKGLALPSNEEEVVETDEVSLFLEVETMKVAELKAQLRERGLRLSGNKADLVARLEVALGQKA